MFIYPTDLNHHITQINEFSYISTEFFNIYIYICFDTYIINNNNLHGFFYLYIHIYLHMSIYFFIYMYIQIYLFVFSPVLIVDRPSHSQCVLNQPPHAAHTTIPWITFCNGIMRFNQSKIFNIFISNVFYMVVRNHAYNNCIVHNYITTASKGLIFSCIQLFIYMY